MDLCFFLLLAIFTSESQGLYIHRSESLSSTLYYRGGSCTWILSGLIPGYDVVLHVNAPSIELKNLDTGVKIVCEVNGTVLLQAVIIRHETLPPPRNLTLDTISKRLQWDHPLLLHLPPDFELVHEFSITFNVYIEGGIGVPSLKVSVSVNYLDITSESVKPCTEYEFVVQAVSNTSHLPPSQNSSAVSGVVISGISSFRHLSAISYKPIHHQQYLLIHITFELEEENCPETHPTFFMVALEGVGEYRVDISSTHIENREGLFLLPLTDPVPNTCSLKGTVFGGNDVGNSTSYEIEFLKGSDCSSAVMSTGTRDTSTVMTSLFSSTPPQDSSGANKLSYVIGAAVGSTTLLTVVILSGVVVVSICIKKLKDYKTEHHRNPPMQTNEAYVTVVRTSRRIKTQPCPAYELAAIET